jgi:hypothetical protein
MKQKLILYTLILMSLASILTSCKKDNYNEAKKPAISILKETYPYEITLEQGSLYYLSISLSANQSTNASLTRFTVEQIFENKTSLQIDSTINTSGLNYQYTLQLQQDTGLLVLMFKIFDANGLSNEVSMKVHITDSRPSISLFKDIAFISQDTTLPANHAFRVGVQALSNPVTNIKLHKFDVISDFNGTVTTPFSEIIDTVSFYKEIVFTSSSVPGTQKLTFHISDNERFWKVVTIKITTE